MATKPARNAPCPCGSGKKYKKCCGLNDPFTPIIPKSYRTGTPYDDYLEVFSLLGLFGQKILQFEEEGRELKKTISDFERRFHPGKPAGLMDSLFMSWVHLDLRFGPSLETIAERFLRNPLNARLAEPGPSLIARLAASYLTFYEVVETGKDAAVLEELGTGKRWTVRYIRDLYEIDPVPGEVWYTRLVGPADGALPYTTPYQYDPQTKAQFQRAVRIQERDFSAGPRASLFPRERHFAESQKEAVLFWAEFIFRGLDDGPAGPDEPSWQADIGDIPSAALPFMVNTDGDEVVFAEMKFRVKDEPALRKRLAALKSFTRDDKNDSWSWLKKASATDPEEGRTVRGVLQVKDGFLLAETNSRERAAWLKAKLKQLLGGLIAYDGTHWRDQHDLPELSSEEKEAYRREQEELNARPEIRETRAKFLEHYYFKKWPSQKVPALGGLTAVQASKTEEGREKLKALLDFYDRMQDAGPATEAKFDFDRLRRMLGLSPRAN